MPHPGTGISGFPWSLTLHPFYYLIRYLQLVLRFHLPNYSFTPSSRKRGRRMSACPFNFSECHFYHGTRLNSSSPRFGFASPAFRECTRVHKPLTCRRRLL